MKTLEEEVGDDEGLRLKIYRDSLGISSIGYGRNLEDVGISKEEADFLRANDCKRAREESEAFWWFNALDEVRQLVVLSMLYQLGLPRFLEFQNMIVALRNRNYAVAAQEMLNSLWAKQTPVRVKKLAKWMETGVCE